jgi:predicted O-methyltransferase YrrM
MLAALMVRHPTEFYDRFSQRKPPGAVPENRPLRVTTTDPQQAIHGLLGLPVCADCGEFTGTEMGHRMDAGTALQKVVRAAVRHLQPNVVIETGVARGYTSAVILSAMRENDLGHLWSIDLPLLDPEWEGTPGMAVNDDLLRDRWTYLRGSSTRRLPQLLPGLDQVDIFIHDSAHSYWVMSEEFDLVWPKIRSGGLLIADDIDDNVAFTEFAECVNIEPVILREDRKQGALGLLRRP